VSEFDDAMSEAFAESIEFFGVATFRLRGLTLSGDLSDLGADEKLAIGGSIPNVKQTLILPWRVFSPPIRNGEYLEIGSNVHGPHTFANPKKLRIGLVESDRVSLTLYLCSPDE
jgi:hypothetical protein